MATSTLPSRLRINGLIDTNQSVVSNMERIARNATSWLSYDTANGKWSVVINKSGTSIHSFNDSNMIGGINVSGKSLDELYNSIEVKYPLRDTADQTDSVILETPSADRSAYEKDRRMTLTLDMVNEPVQAQLLGLIQLKQSRVKSIIEFSADYSTINVQAGDIIDITNDHYDWTAKLFRVVSIQEQQADDGALIIKYKCIEYDADVYDETALTRYLRTDRTDIKSLGVIGTPTAPVVSVGEVDQVPYHDVEMTVPDGVVTKIELWVSFDNTNWEHNHTVSPNEEAVNGKFVPGTTVTLRRGYATIPRSWANGDSPIPTGSYNVYWKFRGVNDVNDGPFSNVTTKTWNPVFTVEGVYSGARMVQDTTGNVPTAYWNNMGNISGVAVAQLGPSSQSDYVGNIQAIPTKDTGAPAYKTITLLSDTANLVAIINNVNTLSGAANVSSYENLTSSDWGTQPSSAHTTAVYNNWTISGVNYDAQILSIEIDNPGGFYDVDIYDPVANTNVTMSGLHGYVPTWTAVYHNEVGNAFYYPAGDRITGLDENQFTFNLTVDSINETRQLLGVTGNISSLAGNVYIYQGLMPGYNVSSESDNLLVYPKNWSTFASYIPGVTIQLYQE